MFLKPMGFSRCYNGNAPIPKNEEMLPTPISSYAVAK